VLKLCRRRFFLVICSLPLIDRNVGAQSNQQLEWSTLPAPDRVISELQGRADKRGLVQLDLRSRFRPGDKIRVVDGVAILLDMPGRKVLVVLDENAVTAG